MNQYKEIFQTHGEISWLILSVFLREMDSCLIKLQIGVEHSDILAVRAELHQMIGAANILPHQELSLLLHKIQDLVKSSHSIKEYLPLIAEVRNQLNDVFDYSMKERPSYHVHWCDNQQLVMNELKMQLLEHVQIESVVTTSTLDDCLVGLKKEDADMLITDHHVGNTTFRNLSMALRHKGIQVPILLFSLEPHVVDGSLNSEFDSIQGYVSKCSSLDTLIQGIKTVANGRDFL